MAYRCKIFVAVTDTSWVLVLCIHGCEHTISKVICMNKEKEICLPNREYINCHR